MGDKGGKKDKAKGQKQTTAKQKQKTKEKLNKQPPKRSSQRLILPLYLSDFLSANPPAPINRKLHRNSVKFQICLNG